MGSQIKILVECLSTLCTDGFEDDDWTSQRLINFKTKFPEFEITEKNNCLDILAITSSVNEPVIDEKHLKYNTLLSTIFDILKRLSKSSSDDFNYSQKQILKSSLKMVILISISWNLENNLPGYVKPPSTYEPKIALKFVQLVKATHSFTFIMKSAIIQNFLLESCMTPFLVASFLVHYCPIAKPSTASKDFIMTKEFHKSIMDFRRNSNIIHKLKTAVPILSLIKHNMLLMALKKPKWLEACVVNLLTAIMHDTGGVQTVTVSILEGNTDYDPNDTAKIWKSLNVLVKLFINARTCEDFEKNICQQIVDLLRLRDRRGISIRPFELLVARTLKELYLNNPEIVQRLVFVNILEPVGHLIVPECGCCNSGSEKNLHLTQMLVVLNDCFIDNHINCSNLPITMLLKYVAVFSRLYQCCVNNFKEICENILVSIVNNANQSTEELLKTLVLASSTNYLNMRNNMHLYSKDNQLLVNFNEDKSLYDNLDFSWILRLDTNVQYEIFTGALELAVNSSGNDIHSRLKILSLLTTLADNEHLQKRVIHNDSTVIPFLEKQLTTFCTKELHRSTDFESSDYKSLFLIVMIIQSVRKESAVAFAGIDKILNKLKAEALNKELLNLIETILGNDSNADSGSHCKDLVTSNAVDTAIAEVCDPLLPVRGHGLLALAKLVEANDPNVLDRQQFILNLFQQNVRNEDSYIYLHAIAGLAAMAESFPELVLPRIVAEYCESSARCHATDADLNHRLKLGEVLARITKALDKDVLNKHKALLLNAGLQSMGDDDFLMRASAISNLAEICRVLDNDLGTILTEIVSAALVAAESDVSVEVRRAGVLLLRTISIGDLRTLQFEHIDAIIRRLVAIHRNKDDDAMMLHAQVALEHIEDKLPERLAAMFEKNKLE